MLTRIARIGSLFLAMGLLAVPATAAEMLSDGEMEGIVAGWFDAEASLTVDAGSTATGDDGSQVISGSTVALTGVANVPVFNGLVVKNDTLATPGTQPGAQKGGHVAAAHFVGAQALVDGRNLSNHERLVRVDAQGDSAAAHGAGSSAIHRGDRGDRDEPSGHGNKTGLLAPWKAQGHGNKGDSQQANDEGEISTEDELGLSLESQKDMDVLIGTNTLDEVGNGANTASALNSKEGTTLLLGLNLGVQATDQSVYNFSETTTVKQTVGVVPINTVVNTAADFQNTTKNVGAGN